MDVTIIIPVWAREQTDLEYLDACLASCAGQAQVSLWNDGSSVDILPVVDKYNVTVGQGQHHGKSYARNKAVENAQTELVYPLDADDYLAPNAIPALLSTWRDVPLYSHLWKVYNGNRLVLHELPAFWCDNLTKTFGISSVNVLHSKAQWETVGGWDERYNLFEDWLYNAKLYHLFCGELVPQPLVYYRQHDRQSTVYYRAEQGNVRRAVRSEIEEYVKIMGCCGGRRTGDIQASKLRRAPNPGFAAAQGQAQPTRTGRYGVVNASSLPGADSGRIVQARYVGGQGKGPHYYRPPNKSRRAYRVRYGETVQADIDDTCSQSEYDGGRPRTLLIRVEAAPPAPPPATPAPPPPPRPAPPVRAAPPPPPSDPMNTAMASMVKAQLAARSQGQPIIVDKPPPPPPIPIVEDLQPLPSTIKLLKGALDSGETLEYQAHAWLREEAGREKPRVTAIKLLEKFIVEGRG